MDFHQGTQSIKQLEKRKGGYFYLKIDSKIIEQFSRKRATRLICTIDENITYRCGLNHLGDGNYFIILASKYLDQLEKELGDTVEYKIEKDPDQLGVDMPEVLTVFLEQEPESKRIFDQLTDGKKRSLIYGILKVKDIDSQVKNIQDFMEIEKRKIKSIKNTAHTPNRWQAYTNVKMKYQSLYLFILGIITTGCVRNEELTLLEIQNYTSSNIHVELWGYPDPSYENNKSGAFREIVHSSKSFILEMKEDYIYKKTNDISPAYDLEE